MIKTLLKIERKIETYFLLNGLFFYQKQEVLEDMYYLLI